MFVFIIIRNFRLANLIFMSEKTPKFCLQCNKPFNGRSDKKFCSHYCRTDYNNILQKKKQADCIKNINEILLHNRDILMEILHKKSGRTTEDKMVAMGFHFHFHTHSIKQMSVIKTYCYDMGYTNRAGTVKVFSAE